MRNNGSRRYTRLLQHSGQCDFETTKFHCSELGQLLEFPDAGSCLPQEEHRQPFRRGRQLVWGRARRRWKPGGSRGHQNGLEGAKLVHPTSGTDRCIQIKQEKHFHLGNAAVGQRGSVFCLQAECVTPVSTAHQQNTGKNCEARGHEFTWSLAPQLGHRWPKLLPAPGENSLGKAGKSTPLHSTFKWPAKENPMQHEKERRSVCIHSSQKEHLSGQDFLLQFTAGWHHHMP